MTLPTIITEEIGGSALARRLAAGDAPTAWYVARPTSPEGWRARATLVAASSSRDWYDRLTDAFSASGTARERLERVSRDGGVVVTTGQQPGLFGGPIYTWSKAIAALELANAIERETGIPSAPVFWAATDDADFAEASDTWISFPGGAERLVARGEPVEGIPMSEQPLGDVSDVLRRLSDGAGSAVDPGVLDAVRLAYRSGETVGGAYVALLRHVLQPLGIGVLDASHPALLRAERPVLTRALERAAVVADALSVRSAELRAVGHEPQVADVDGLSLVFGRAEGRKVRIPLHQAADVRGRGVDAALSPDVLLRPLAECAVLPTVAYVGGPGEITYFAQVSAVAVALGIATPLVVPRWSCTIVEPHIAGLLDARGVARHEVSDRHAVEGRLARRSAPVGVVSALEALRARIDEGTFGLAEALAEAPGLLAPEAIEGARRQMAWRAERVERRVVAALKRRDDAMRRDVGTLSGALFPGGKRQERALNLLPILARYGAGVLDAMRAAAARHAAALVHGQPLPVDRA